MCLINYVSRGQMPAVLQVSQLGCGGTHMAFVFIPPASSPLPRLCQGLAGTRLQAGAGSALSVPLHHSRVTLTPEALPVLSSPKRVAGALGIPRQLWLSTL